MDELASLQESARQIGLERFRIIQPYLEQDKSLNVIARKAGIPYRTILSVLLYREFRDMLRRMDQGCGVAAGLRWYTHPQALPMLGLTSRHGFYLHFGRGSNLFS